MKDASIPNGTKLKILECIASNPSSASEVAKQLKISLPYALTQLELLEAKELVKAEIKPSTGQVGKPKKTYSLKNEHIQITLLGEGFGKRFASNNIDPQMRIYFQFLSYISDKNKMNFSEYYWKFHNHIQHIIAIAKVRVSGNESEFLAFTTTEHLTVLRQKISSYKTEQQFKIACWVHTEDEFLEGVMRNDHYYTRLLDESKPMMDTRGVFERLGEYKK